MLLCAVRYSKVHVQMIRLGKDSETVSPTKMLLLPFDGPLIMSMGYLVTDGIDTIERQGLDRFG